MTDGANGNPTWLPYRVLEIDLAEPVPPLRARDNSGRQFGGAWVLLRIFGEPVGSVVVPLDGRDISPATVVRRVPAWAASVVRERLRVVGVASREGEGLPYTGCTPKRLPPFHLHRQTVLESGPAVTAVICTRDQPEGLAKCLASLQAQSYPRTSILVVDNASTTQASRAVAEASRGPFSARYVYEPRPGLSNARNRSLREVRTDLVAWIDDDEIADPHWLCAIVDGFLREPHAAAVCGVMVPGELETVDQYWFEEYGGHSKGRGFIPAVFCPETRHTHNPLFPLPPFGTGGNMAMKLSELNRLGGFDCGFDRALGAGTPTFGAEDTRALTEILLRGGTVRYHPTAVTWHFHRRDHEGLRRQLYGYGTGLSAFYTSLVWDRPLLALSLLRLLPRALRDLRDPEGPRLGSVTSEFPADLLREHRKGMIRGPVAYARTRLRTQDDTKARRSRMSASATWMNDR